MKWFVVTFLLFHGHLEQGVYREHGPWATKAQCERWLTAWQTAQVNDHKPIDLDDPQTQALLKQAGWEHVHIGCTLVGDQ